MAPATMITTIPLFTLKSLNVVGAVQKMARKRTTKKLNTTKKLKCEDVCRLVFGLCKAATNLKHMSGSFTPKTLQKALGKVRGEHLFDIGAHAGLVVLLALTSFGFKAASGCEYKENNFLNYYFQLCKKKLEEKCGRTLNAMIKFKAFAKVRIPPEADVVFTFNAVFDPEDQHLIMQEVKNAEHVKYFICTKSRVFERSSQVVAAMDNTFELVATVDGRMSGSGQQHQIFVLRRTM